MRRCAIHRSFIATAISPERIPVLFPGVHYNGTATTHQFNWVKVLLNTIPFLLLVVAAVSLLRRRRSLLYYLIVVDGLMLVKAVCGIIAMLFF